MQALRGSLTLVLVVALGACATIMHGTRQEVGISSSPTNARVTVDNMPLGNTPLVTELSRKNSHIVRIELAGYAPYEATLTKKVSGWVWGNIVFGGLIGLAVDAITGGLYSLTPEEISGALAAQAVGDASTLTANGLYIVLVREADPSWMRIGTLSH